MSNKYTKKKFIENTGWMIGQQIYTMLLSLVIGALSARYLGPSNYGVLNIGTSIISIFLSITRLGMDGIIINEMLKQPQKQGVYLGSTLLVRFLVSVGAIICIFVTVWLLYPNDEVIQVVILLQSISIIFQLYEVFVYWFQMNLKMSYVSLAVMLAQTVVGVWKIVLLLNGAAINLFALSDSVNYLVCGVVLILIFYRIAKIKLIFSAKEAKYLLGKSYHLIVANLAIALYMQIDKVMIGKMLDETTVGIYTVATVIASMWQFVPIALIDTARPVIMEKRTSDYEEYLKLFQKLLLGTTIICVIIGILMSLFSKIAIWILYGEQYLGATVPLIILTWASVFAIIGTARGIWSAAENYNAYSKYMVIMGAILNIVCNIVGIKLFGILGASIATLISQFAVLFIMPLFFKDTRVFCRIYFKSFYYISEIKEIIGDIFPKSKTGEIK